MDMSLEDFILQKNIQKPQQASEDGVKKQSKLQGGWVKKKKNGAVKHKRTNQKIIETVTKKSGEGLSSVTKGVCKFAMSTEPTKLLVSNLDYQSVTESDIIALFRKFGPLKKASLNYDKNGQSQGSAEIVYERPGDAIKAMSEYSGMSLDGRKIVIQIAISEIPTVNPARLSSVTNRLTNGVTGNGVVKNKIHQKNIIQNNVRIKSVNEELSIEDLDAELDEYIKNRI